MSHRHYGGPAGTAPHTSCLLQTWADPTSRQSAVMSPTLCLFIQTFQPEENTLTETFYGERGGSLLCAFLCVPEPRVEIWQEVELPALILVKCNFS